jgi:hypothetical protein
VNELQKTIEEFAKQLGRAADPVANVENIGAAVRFAHRVVAALLDVDGRDGEAFGYISPALHLNLAEAELREAVADHPHAIPLTRLPDLGDLVLHDVSTAVSGVVGLLGSVLEALLRALDPAASLDGSLAAARAAVQIDDARRALSEQIRPRTVP